VLCSGQMAALPDLAAPGSCSPARADRARNGWSLIRSEGRFARNVERIWGEFRAGFLGVIKMEVYLCALVVLCQGGERVRALN
jgi:hypothetical protein